MSYGERVVCVTGGSGYVASWLVKHLLLRGYTVRATVRNLSDPTKVSHLKALEGAEGRLHLFEANLLEDGSFDVPIHGCQAVFHTASPCIYAVTNPQAELIEPAVRGTLNVLKSCTKTSSVRRVVLTSSIVALLCNTNTKASGVLVDESWFSDKLYCQQAKLWYPLSKIMAEEAAWKFAQENGMDLVVINPGLVIGPLIQPTLNYATQFFLEILKGNKVSYSGEYDVFPTYDIVDARDVADAHILGFENPSASGRYSLVGTTLSFPEIRHVLHQLYPSIGAPHVATEYPTYKVSRKKAESLGINFVPLEESLKTTIEFLKENNLLTL